VSTWFANARRRLKKENKMQWSPRNRTGDDDDDDDDNKNNASDLDDDLDGRRTPRSLCDDSNDIDVGVDIGEFIISCVLCRSKCRCPRVPVIIIGSATRSMRVAEIGGLVTNLSSRKSSDVIGVAFAGTAVNRGWYSLTSCLGNPARD
jgi:hypothetical protein